MKITVKSVTNKVFHIQVDPDLTVGELKNQIEQEQGSDYPATGQKLIYAGHVLKDNDTLKHYNINEDGFLVIIVSKPPSAATNISIAEKNPPPQDVLVTPESKVVDLNKEQQTKPKNVSAESTFLTSGPQMQSVISDLMNMGFEKESALKALKASYNNPSRAVEYLINGIPSTPIIGETTMEDSSVVAPMGENMQPLLDTSDSELSQADQDILVPQTGIGGSSDDPLGFLRNLPQFRQMRELVQQNPNLLQLFVQLLGQQNPQLLQRITDNQERFIQMLNEPLDESTENLSAVRGGANPPIIENQIVVTPSEREAIERLKAMGFPEGMVIQAYFACDKDENLAANFLLTQNLAEEDDQRTS